jgi:multiple sugar transport system substrate-binding protein
MRAGPAAAAARLATLAIAACGGSGSKSGTATLNLWVFQEPSGSFTDAAKRCSQQSHGRYKIVFNALSNDADQQRQALVRRLAAKDSSIDIAGMDVVWTAEFAEAGWIKPWPAAEAAKIRQGTLAGPLKTATYKGQLWAAPANTNTQLLWYRKDLVSDPATTWDGLIDQASKLPKANYIEIQGAQYEGVTMRFNSLVQSAGGTIVSDGKATLGHPGLRAAQIMRSLAKSKAGDPSISAEKEDQNRLAFEAGKAAFEVNYPFIYPSAKEGAPQIFKQLAWKPYPAVDNGKPAKAPIGGINWGVGAYTKHRAEAFAAAACLARRAEPASGGDRGRAAPKRSTASTTTRASRRPIRSATSSAGRSARAPCGPRRQPTPTSRWPSPRPSRRRRRSSSAASSTTCAASSRTRSNRRGCSDRDHHRGPEGRRAAEAEGHRPRAGRAPPRLSAVRAGGARDARRHRLSDRLRDLPVAAARRPALPRPEHLGRPRQLHHRADRGGVVARRVAHAAHHRGLGLDRARAGDDAGADHAPRDLRARRDPYGGARAVRDHHRRRRVRLALCLVGVRGRLRAQGLRLRLRPGRHHRAVLELRRGDPHRGLEDHAVHGPAAACGPDDRARRAARGRASTARPTGSASGASRFR